MKRQVKVIYYKKTTDDFAGTHIKTRKVDNTFRFIPAGILSKAVSFLLYYVVAFPPVYLYMKIAYHTKIINRGAVRQIQGGFFLYGNHTHWSDAYLGHLAAAPRRTYVVASPDAVSIRGLQNIVMMLGAIPIPTEAKGLRKFSEAVKKCVQDGNCVTIFPEAHIWPYYTGIRPFPATSFAFPAELGLPVVAMVTTYRTRKGLLRFSQTPLHTVTLSDPIYAPPGLSLREAQRYLCGRVSDFMKECAGQEGKLRLYTV